MKTKQTCSKLQKLKERIPTDSHSRNAKGSPSIRRKMIPDRNLDIHKEIKTLEMAIQWDLLFIIIIIIILDYCFRGFQ